MSQRDDATLPDTRPQAVAPPHRVAAPDLGDRYEVGDVLGRGGMGEIRLARDTRIHRDVAVKLMRSAQRDEATLGRFFREARVQGVLDHPAVVPVHDLGIDADGAPYFVMKRLAGTTLADLLASTDAELAARWPRRQLLARLVDVCLAVEFAHTRGVIHRDLKPANIMLGNFGEAYVLDWGLARIADARDDLPEVLPLSGDDLGHTAAGDLLGTPGYMSPEQARGEPIDPRTDVFALGCVLFEILAGKPALPRGMAGIAETLSAASHRPSRVASDIPPELDDLCARATAASANQRPDARALADGIQAFLDGDRDLTRRRELAAEHARTAREAMASPSDDGRATAMREAGRAIALDPTNATAQDVLASLLVAAPTTIPAGALAEADAERARSIQAVLHWARRGYFAIVLLGCGLFLLPVRQLWPVLATLGVSIATWLLARWLSQRTVPGRSPWFVALLLLTSTQLAMAGVMLGPLLIVPVFVIGAIGAFLCQPTEYHGGIVIGGFVIPLVGVVGLELIGVLPRTIHFHDGSLVLTAPAVPLTPLTTAVIIGCSFIAQLINTVFVATSTMRAQRTAQDAVHAQRWHLAQLVPRASETPLVPKLEPPPEA